MLGVYADTLPGKSSTGHRTRTASRSVAGAAYAYITDADAPNEIAHCAGVEHGHDEKFQECMRRSTRLVLCPRVSVSDL